MVLTAVKYLVYHISTIFSLLMIQSISQQLTNALRNPDQLVESIRSTQSKEQVLIVSEASSVISSGRETSQQLTL